MEIAISSETDFFKKFISKKQDYYIFQASLQKYKKILSYYSKECMLKDSKQHSHPLLHELISQSFCSKHQLVTEKMIITWNHCKNISEEILDSKDYVDEYGFTAKQRLFISAHHDYIRCRKELRDFFRENKVRIGDPDNNYLDCYYKPNNFRNRYLRGIGKSRWDDDDEPNDFIDDLQREYAQYSANKFKKNMGNLTTEDIEKLLERYVHPFFDYLKSSDEAKRVIKDCEEKVNIMKSNKAVEEFMYDKNFDSVDRLKLVSFINDM